MHASRSCQGVELFRPKKTPAQTLTRVRENQRRHRERRRQYIESLEHKLTQTEQLLIEAQNQISKLQAELARSRDDRSGAKGQNHCLSGLPTNEVSHEETIDTIANKTLPQNAAHVFSELEDATDVLDDATASPFILDRLEQGSLPLNNLPNNADNLLAGPQAPFCEPQASQVCCSAAISYTGSSQPNLATPKPITVADLHEGQLYAASFYNDYPSADEHSTTPCVQAYIAIAQQNFRGVELGVIQSALYKGFRRAATSGGGCRVLNRVLFELLDFISDT